jgi:hypothetical protein
VKAAKVPKTVRVVGYGVATSWKAIVVRLTKTFVSIRHPAWPVQHAVRYSLVTGKQTGKSGPVSYSWHAINTDDLALLRKLSKQPTQVKR